MTRNALSMLLMRAALRIATHDNRAVIRNFVNVLTGVNKERETGLTFGVMTMAWADDPTKRKHAEEMQIAMLITGAEVRDNLSC